jgi:hypothetical protein
MLVVPVTTNIIRFLSVMGDGGMKKIQRKEKKQEGDFVLF